MKISVFGLGYVGCVSIGCFASLGHKLIGVDVDKRKVDLIKKGKPTIIEQDISKLIRDGHKKKYINATTDSENAVVNSEISIICVGTPSDDNGHLDLSYVFSVAKVIGKALIKKSTYHIVVIRSTTKPGTNSIVRSIIEKESGKKSGKNFEIVTNPEFLREGVAVKDFYPCYTLIGTDSKKAFNIMKKLYEGIEGEIILSNILVSEMIKYVNNSFHALKISFANEIGRVCDKMNINSMDVMNIFSKDNKLNISPKYLKPGFAYGGSCLPKDLKALNMLGHDNFLDLPVLNSVKNSNEEHINYAYKKIINYKCNKIGFLGITFKPGTDDLRYSPAITIIEKLIGKGFNIIAYDKNLNYSDVFGTNKSYVDEKVPHINRILKKSPEEVISESQLIVINHLDKNIRQILKNYKNINKYFFLARI